MRKTNSLGLMFDRFAIYDRRSKLFHNGLVDGIALLTIN